LQLLWCINNPLTAQSIKEIKKHKYAKKFIYPEKSK